MAEQQRNEDTLRKIPLSVDEPIPILFWNPIDFIAALTIFGMGVALKLFLFGMVGGVLVLIVATKLRQGAKRGAAQHWLWHMGLNIDPCLQRLKITSSTNDFIK